MKDTRIATIQHGVLCDPAVLRVCLFVVARAACGGGGAPLYFFLFLYVLHRGPLHVLAATCHPGLHALWAPEWLGVQVESSPSSLTLPLCLGCRIERRSSSSGRSASRAQRSESGAQRWRSFLKLRRSRCVHFSGGASTSSRCGHTRRTCAVCQSGPVSVCGMQTSCFPPPTRGPHSRQMCIYAIWPTPYVCSALCTSLDQLSSWTLTLCCCGRCRVIRTTWRRSRQRRRAL